jgi:hypothetical protein
MLNNYGLDATYFKQKLELLVMDINYYTPEQLRRELQKLVVVLERQEEMNKHSAKC